MAQKMMSSKRDLREPGAVRLRVGSQIGRQGLKENQTHGQARRASSSYPCV